MNPKLSICIPTFNRASFIESTLDSILNQVTNDCEVVVLDGGSTDETEVVMSRYTNHFPAVRYFRQETNEGVDLGYDRAVELARGEYCWLMSDDDILKHGAVAAVLRALSQDFCLIIVNAELRDTAMSTVLQRRWLDLKSDRVYEAGETDRLFEETDDLHLYSGCVVIKRAIWLARERKRFYGSMYIHVGIVFQRSLPGNALVIAEPFISYRMGNVHTFSPHVSENFLVKWPSLVRSLGLSARVKRRVVSAEPWRHPLRLLLLRGMDLYSRTQYRLWIHPQLNSVSEMLIPAAIALLPGVLVNAFFVCFYLVRRRDRGRWMPGIMRSRFYVRNWRVFRRAEITGLTS